ncbi:uncharacterized protein LOC126311233 [Schistocerca gregaria]|uniref:uncharacterized protein LOC126311233 n=1 Tax=Schistocerca gregaria TaxID=7010 RepID=UPI00211E3B8C|nr:uncharacterized protein LOC126311233 [Schistocerca gregaria]
MYSSNSIFESIPEAPEDAVFGIQRQCSTDEHEMKLDLSVGAYRTEEGKPWILPVVKKAELKLMEIGLNHEYLPIEGNKRFSSLAANLILGDAFYNANTRRIVSVQALSGTGAVRLGAEFACKWFRNCVVYISNPTWVNHKNIFNTLGIKVRTYRYWNAKTFSINFEGMKQDLRDAPDGCLVVLHACAHNPTGTDPTQSQWVELSKIFKEKSHIPFFDSSYQGFATGDLDKDAFPIRYFASQGHEMFIAQSFAKNMGLYGERVGAFTAITTNARSFTAIKTQLCRLIRANYSNPPRFGAAVAEMVLGDPALFQEWKLCLKSMAERLQLLREKLYDTLILKKTPGDWSHILRQIGLFCYTGITAKQVEHLVTRFHIYLIPNGRISLAGLSAKTIPYLVDSLHAVIVEPS